MKPVIPPLNAWLRQDVTFTIDGKDVTMSRKKYFDHIGKKPEGVLPEDRQKYFRELNAASAVGFHAWHISFQRMKAATSFGFLSPLMEAAEKKFGPGLIITHVQ